MTKYRIVSFVNHNNETKYQLQANSDPLESDATWTSIFTSMDLDEVRDAKKRRETPFKFTVIE
jgi:hypothetical protein